jgi:hypothetical protein
MSEEENLLGLLPELPKDATPGSAPSVPEVSIVPVGKEPQKPNFTAQVKANIEATMDELSRRGHLDPVRFHELVAGALAAGNSMDDAYCIGCIMLIKLHSRCAKRVAPVQQASQMM